MGTLTSAPGLGVSLEPFHPPCSNGLWSQAPAPGRSCASGDPCPWSKRAASPAPRKRLTHPEAEQGRDRPGLQKKLTGTPIHKKGKRSGFQTSAPTKGTVSASWAVSPQGPWTVRSRGRRPSAGGALHGAFLSQKADPHLPRIRRLCGVWRSSGRNLQVAAGRSHLWQRCQALGLLRNVHLWECPTTATLGRPRAGSEHVCLVTARACTCTVSLCARVHCPRVQGLYAHVCTIVFVHVCDQCLHVLFVCARM